MPIEIRELVIKSTVTRDGQLPTATGLDARAIARLKQDILKELTRKLEQRQTTPPRPGLHR